MKPAAATLHLLLFFALLTTSISEDNDIRVNRGKWKYGRWQSDPPGDLLSADSDTHHRFQCMTTSAERQVLMEFYEATAGIGWLKKWDHENKPCPCVYDWYGLTCDRHGHITAIDLAYNNLTGIIPASISTLNYLTSLRLNSNFLSGVIPPELADLHLLTTLHLQANRFSRVSPKPLVPQVIASMPTLRDFMITKEESIV